MLNIQKELEFLSNARSPLMDNFVILWPDLEKFVVNTDIEETMLHRSKKKSFSMNDFFKSSSKIFVCNITKTEKFVAHTPSDCQIFASETSNCINIMENLLDNRKFAMRPIVFITIFRRMR